MAPDADFVFAALLQHNYLPTQKEAKDELPGSLSSVSFTPGIAAAILAGKQRQGNLGYDAVEYRLTRFNGVARLCSIPHPTAYAAAADSFRRNWPQLGYICTNSHSLVRPLKHSDGRLFVMDYDTFADRAERTLTAGFERRFVVHTDISNCYASLYSHALAWASVGFSHAKANRGSGEWFNQLDASVRRLKRNETQGVAVGPGTSNLAAEIILARVDAKLAQKFSHFRYVDDYTAYCRTEDEAQEFIRSLSAELNEYKLLLSIGKTKVVPLPQPLSDDWVSELSLALPGPAPLNIYDVVSYLNAAVRVASRWPDGSVLKFAVRSLMRTGVTSGAAPLALRYVVNLAFHQPVLLPLLASAFSKDPYRARLACEQELQAIALENAKCRRSDGLTWCLHYLNKHGVVASQQLGKAVLDSKDCLPLLLLSRQAAWLPQVVAFAKALDPSDIYELDRNWLLLYELYREGHIASPYPDEDAFEIMAAAGVSFVGDAAQQATVTGGAA